MIQLLLIKILLAFFFPALHLLQELSKIAMPVIFNEPLSFLQRLSEYMEHTQLIHRANATPDSIERMKVAVHLEEEEEEGRRVLFRVTCSSDYNPPVCCSLCCVRCGVAVGENWETIQPLTGRDL